MSPPAAGPGSAAGGPRGPGALPEPDGDEGHFIELSPGSRPHRSPSPTILSREMLFALSATTVADDDQQHGAHPHLLGVGDSYGGNGGYDSYSGYGAFGHTSGEQTVALNVQRLAHAATPGKASMLAKDSLWTHRDDQHGSGDYDGDGDDGDNDEAQGDYEGEYEGEGDYMYSNGASGWMQPRQGGWTSGWISLGSRAAQPSQQDRRVRRKRAASPASTVLRSCLSRSAVGICAAVLLVAVLCVALLARPGGWPSDDTRSLLNELRHTVILVSLDGFRPDYLDRGLTPNLNRLARQGVRAVGMQPAFPSVTFPNHYTIVTGLYPESHGVVGNTYYDPIRKSAFEYTNPEMNADGYWWNGGEPIWVTAVKQGKRAATCMWPGSEAEIRGVRPTHWLKYNGSMSLDEKIDHVVSWLDLPRSQRPSFLSLYISDVDGAGHTGGIHSDLVASALQRVDNAIGRLHRLLEARHIADLVNLIIVSDHGMADTSTDRVIFLDDYVNLDSIRTLVNGPVWSVYPTTVTQEAVLKQLADGASAHGHFKTFLRSQVPSEYHFQQSDRIAPILVVADPDWSIAPSRREFDPQHPSFPKGMHGYNNSDAEMQALFLAHGSAFKRPLDGTARIPSFANTEVYQMLAKLIGVEAAPNNGSRAWLDAFSADWLAA